MFKKCVLVGLCASLFWIQSVKLEDLCSARKLFGALFIGSNSILYAQSNGTLISGTPWDQNHGQLIVYSSESYAIDKGGEITFGGKYESTGINTPFGGVKGAKETASSGSLAGYLAFRVRNIDSTMYERIRITSEGKVGIGTTNPSEKLYVVGNITATGSITQGSSKELKKDIICISTDEAVESLQGLNPVKYKYKADRTEEEQLGFIAEDVPELVATHDHKRLSAMDITAVLTKVVQEQQKQIQQLRDEMSELKKSR